MLTALVYINYAYILFSHLSVAQVAGRVAPLGRRGGLGRQAFGASNIYIYIYMYICIYMYMYVCVCVCVCVCVYIILYNIYIYVCYYYYYYYRVDFHY